MIEINRSRLKAENRNVELKPKLEEFLEKVALIKPLCKFEVADKDVETYRYKDNPKDSNEEWKHKQRIKRIRIYENGERIGSIGIGERWRGRQTEDVYEVEGFRINKCRGRQNVTQSKDLKVAIREAKNSLAPREDTELKELIQTTVTNNISQMHASQANALRWDFNIEGELCFYAMEAYKARRRGDKWCNLPVNPVSVRDLSAHDEKCEAYEALHKLFDLVKAKKGYGVRTNHDSSIAIYSFETDSITKVNSYTDLPEEIANKYAVFKVLAVNEPQPNIGIKFQENYAFIVP